MSEATRARFRRRRAAWLAAAGVFVLGCVVAGALAWRPVARWVRRAWILPGYTLGRGGRPVPVSVRPGLPRSSGAPWFLLDATNSQRMAGADDPLNERWRDIAGNAYADAFRRSFSYARSDPAGPEVRLRVDAEGPTFRGRIEGRRLKPNFVYQMKLRGVWSDRAGFEAIGYAGRWLIPGGGTNWTDEQYRRHADKERVEAYIYFDYLLTDARGDGVRDFELDSSLHITWNAARQRADARASDIVPVLVRSDDPAVYAWPRSEPTVELLWNEREAVRYAAADEVIRLPPRAYRAELALTEESFHSYEYDGGFWATVYTCPVQFAVTPPGAATAGW